MKKNFLLTDFSDLSTRSQNIINNLGGIDKTLDFYRQHRGFLSISKIGKFSNAELSSFCEYLLFVIRNKSEEQQDNSNLLKNEINSPFFKKIKSALSGEAQKVIHNFGGEIELLEFYNHHKSFTSYIKVTSSLNKELIHYCKLLLLKEQELSANQSFEILLGNHIEKYIEIYEIEKAFLSRHTYKVLRRLERKFEYLNSKTNQIEFIKTMFIQSNDFSVFKNIGLKSKNEIDILKGKIINTVISDDVDENANLISILTREVNRAILIKISESEMAELIDDYEFSFSKLFCILLINNELVQDKSLIVLKHRYFSTKTFDINIVANDLNCSLEWIRQQIRKLNRTVIPWAVTKTHQILKNIGDGQSDSFEKNILFLENFPHFVFQNIEYTPNTELSKIFYSHTYKKHFRPIEFFISSLSKSFVMPVNNLIVSKKFITEVHFVEFLVWLNVEIFNFESIGFDYKLDVLIKRFYSENNLSIDNNLLSDLITIISSIKRQNFVIKETDSKRQRKKEFIDKLIEEVWSFLNQKKDGQTTQEILNHLNSNNIVIDKITLLRYLHKRESTFIYYGNGNWTLKEWHSVQSQSGTLRKIIHGLLLNSKTPMHISEIFHCINSSKKVSLNSLRTNLRADKKATFKFFNCYYFGLNEKIYDDSWSAIPVFKSHLLVKNIKKVNIKQEKEIIEFLFKDYGYPKQHIQFLIDCKRGKYSFEKEMKQTALKFNDDLQV